MKWLRFRHEGAIGFGTLAGDAVEVHEGSMFDSPRATGARLALAAIEWLVPCVPAKVIGLWNNFGALADKNGWARPAEPLYFLKATSSLAAHGQAIPAPPADAGRIAYEGELAIVIGRRAQRVSVEDASAHVFGYACANDVTAIELLHRDASFAQWARAKSFDGFGAIGPVVDTAFDPSAATLRTRVAGRERQNYPLADMLFGPAELVSRLSHDMTLEPGDVILCGTSLGVLPMKPGSTVEVEIDGLGTLSNTFG
ncbi:MAG TPA: fumarylacetoacetate hydrolase family protein [Methylibium sp.]|uniref:fumarylacetoacetate hydrolase family protein n=1 Tax=Methylibium sp. TaxID=2067992 RepID=UPI002DB8FE8E|nr:fumarylacetoacetate hydrolase family protein [Methylibium sp.]HEU4457716.1 fumarylacetoacetate hydrolase family protein [Methylibium sp.]